LPSPPTISTAGLAPGVRFQWISRPAPPGVPRTDIAGFVGIAERGDLHTPTRIESLAQFTSTFGPSLAGAYLADAVAAFFANGGTTCWIVRVADPDTSATATLDLAYPDGQVTVELRAASPGTWAERIGVTCIDLGAGTFTLALELADEGLAEQWRGVSVTRGQSRAIDQVLEGSALVDAWILDDQISIARGGTSDAARIDLLDAIGTPRVRLELQGTQTWERRVDVTVTPTGPGTFNLGLDPEDPAIAGASFENLSIDPTSRLWVVNALANGTLVQATAIPPAGGAAATGQPIPTAAGAFTGGADGLVNLAPVHFSGEGAPDGQRWGLATLALVDEVSIVAMPDAARLTPPVVAPPSPAPPDCSQLVDAPAPVPQGDGELTFSQDQVVDLSNALIRHCMQLQDRVAMLDPPAAGMNADEVIDWRIKFTSSYGALYYPWLLVVSDAGDLRALPPSGAMAGILARVSLRDSAAKPPANEPLDGVAAVVARVDELTHSRLNDRSVNAIRAVAGRGLRILGARTCLAPPGFGSGATGGSIARVTPDPTGLGFLNVRRVVTMVEAVVAARLQLAVFEGNLPRTWSAIEQSVRVFLDDLWHAGGLDGAQASDAYLVRCDASTNPQVDVDQGRLTCIVGIRPPWPAEFVFVRVSATASGTDVHEGSADA
jgi:hypothetical protein